MLSPSAIWRSTIGKKAVMAVTGMTMIGVLILQMLANLLRPCLGFAYIRLSVFLTSGERNGQEGFGAEPAAHGRVQDRSGKACGANRWQPGCQAREDSPVDGDKWGFADTNVEP